MKIDTRGESAVYVEIDEWTYIIDNSTNEHIVERWRTGETELYQAKWELEK